MSQTPGTKEGPRHKPLRRCNWVITWPLLNLNNVDLNGYVKISHLKSLCLVPPVLFSSP